MVAGLLAQFSSTYRNVYFFAIGLQALTFAMLWWFLPDFPKKQRSMSYFKIMYRCVPALVPRTVLSPR